MTNAHHDDAVALLTSPDRFVRLMLQREVRGSLTNVLSPRSPSVLDPEGYLSNRPGKRFLGFNKRIYCNNISY